MHRPFAVGWVVCVALAFADCKSKPKSDELPDPDRDQLLAEQKRIERGEKVGELLVSPKIVVDSQQITVNGHRVGARSELPSHALQKVSAFFNWMKGLREHWKQIHPGENFDASADVTLTPDLSFYEGASLIQTLAFAGYPYAMTIRTGAQTLRIDVFVPGPPVPDEETKPPPSKKLELCHSPTWQVRYSYPDASFSGISPTAPFGLEQSDAPGRRITGPALAWRPLTPADAPAVVTELCRDQCERLTIGVEGSPPAFIDALAISAAALRAKNAKPMRLSFASCTLASADAGAPAPAASGKPAKIRTGQVSINGALAAEDIDRVVRGKFDEFRSCYAQGAARNPNLVGRVAARVTIDEQGVISSLGNGGSDLPDSAVVGCVLESFKRIAFPKPERGVATLVYPLLFEPG